MIRRPLAAAAALAALALPLPARSVAPPGTAAGEPTGPAAETAAQSGGIGAPAPAFALRTVDGKSVSLAGYRGKTLVLNIWATWCPPCREETPSLVAGYKRLRASNVAFLGVDTTEDASLVRAFAAAKGDPIPQAVDTEHRFATAYDIRYFPTTIVIDPQGIVRARHVDVIGPAQLQAYIAAAKDGRTASIASPLQAKIDALLTPGTFVFGGDAQNVRAQVRAAADAIAKADALTDDSDAASGNVTDFYKIRAEERALRDRAIAALEPLASGDPDRAMLARLRGDAASASEDWSTAALRYTEALAIDPKDVDALSGLGDAEAAQNHDQAALEARDRLASLEPTASNEIGLAQAYAKLKDWPPALSSADAAIAAAERTVATKPGAPSTRMLAWSHLYAGRIAARAGDAARARREFAAVTAQTLKLPKTDARYAMYLEEAQEATVAIGLHASQTTLSLAPWTGPELPGSIPDTIKYRLVVSGLPGKSVALRASGLPKRWVASFCTDRVCAPFHVTVALPPAGVKVVEFQVVPDGPALAARPTVRVEGNDGVHRASAVTIVAAR